METRNQINILSSDALVFCPGNEGTHSELDISIKYNRPAIIYLGNEHGIDGMGREELAKYGHPFAENVDQLQAFLEAYQAK